MAIFKCKMCGGSLNIVAGTTVIECDYCGTRQTLPKLDDDRRANMYDRANHFRRNNDFDKAMGIYEQILTEDNADAEAYWSLVLCRYGIEYVEDPTSHKRIPTVNRVQFTSIFDDADYKSALKNADSTQRAVYEAEAKAINEIQKGILAISQKEEPFDVFICYKESDANGRRTPDSVLAQELYFGLKNEGFKVFFARITLEDKLGSAYEPYIFAALNSSKAMVVLGTKPEYFNAVWVKNEWSRYLALIKQGQKKVLIPAYKDMDPYDLPEEFSHLQAQDMTKLGFMQDLIRGITKLVKVNEPKQTVVKQTVTQETVASTGVIPIAPLLRRAFMFLEDGDWDSAKEYGEKVLDLDPEHAQAYFVKFLADFKLKNSSVIVNSFADSQYMEKNANYQKAMRFADDNFRAELQGYIDATRAQYEQAKLQKKYNDARNKMQQKTSASYALAANIFGSIPEYLDARQLQAFCVEQSEICRKNEIYEQATAEMKEEGIYSIQKAITLFKSIPGWKDADQQVTICTNLIKKREEETYAAQIKKYKLVRTIVIAVAAVIVAIISTITLYNRFVTRDFYVNAHNRESIGYTGAQGEELIIPDVFVYGGKKYRVRGIDASAFRNCTGLVSVTIPGSADYISNYAFDNCTSLTSITIPDSVTSIGKYAFNGCTSLASIILPNSITSIDEATFNGCTSLASIVIPNNVTSIGWDAFWGCTSLTSITIPNSVTRINRAAFSNCSSLTSIEIPDSITDIDEYAFRGCSDLTSITLPNSVTSIEAGAFDGCTGLTSITVAQDNPVYHSDGNCLIETANRTLVVGCKSSLIPNDGSVRCIGDNAFWGCTGLTSIHIPSSVTSMGRYAFGFCSDLTTITFDGTTAQWERIDMWVNWNVSSPITEVICSDGTVSLS